MTRKEKDLKVLELFGLKVGDRIKIKEPKYFYMKKNIPFKIIEHYEHGEECICLDDGSLTPFVSVDILIKEDWEKVEPLLKDKKCGDFINCEGCPFSDSFVSCGDIESVGENLREATLEDIYNGATKELKKLKKEIYGEE